MGSNELMRTRVWLKGLLERYYSGLKDITAPVAIAQREFGFGSFSKKITIRHRSFRDKGALLDYIRKEAPAHVNHSMARYEFPENPNMPDKNRLGTDMVFDIDVGDLKLDHSHDDGWLCEDCFTALKEEARKLVDFLEDDFGFSNRKLSVNFSGSRGYHVRIRDEDIIDLDEAARKEICGYLSLEMDLSELIFERGGMIYGPRPDQHGLRGRIARRVMEAVEASEMQNRDQVIRQIKEGNWGAFPKGYGLKRILGYAKTAAVKIPVDSKVTTDLSHMIRMPDTIHGGSCLLAKTVGDLDSFNPLDECFVFGEEEKEVEFIKATPQIVARGGTFGPFKKGRTGLPTYLAAYMCAKGRAVVV